MKPGIKTTEFWLTLLATVGGVILAVVQATRPEQVNEAQTAWEGLTRLAEVVLPLLLPLVLGNQYVTARAALKIHGSRGQ